MQSSIVPGSLVSEFKSRRGSKFPAVPPQNKGLPGKKLYFGDPC